MATGNYHRAIWCENCGVVPVHPADKYCDACAEDIQQWICAAEMEEEAQYNDQLYIVELEEKQLNFRFDV